jgi:Asp/Glu/hydantoin racemase
VHPDVGAIVLECANMPPYAAALRARAGLPVYDLVDLGKWLYAGLAATRSRT